MTQTIGRGLAAVGLIVLVAGPLFAHAVVYPGEAAPGAWQKYVLRVPNERDVPTVRVALRFPPAVRVVSFADVAGWEMETTSRADGRVTEAVWTGVLPVGRFVEFPFVAVNPEAETRLKWDASQTYEDGDQVDWAGPEGSATPASFTVVTDPAGGPGTAVSLAALAVLVSLVALGLALRPRASTGP